MYNFRGIIYALENNYICCKRLVYEIDISMNSQKIVYLLHIGDKNLTLYTPDKPAILVAETGNQRQLSSSGCTGNISAKRGEERRRTTTVAEVAVMLVAGDGRRGKRNGGGVE